MPRSDSNPPDPVYVHSRREAVVILLIWAVSLTWTVGYCWGNAYESQESRVESREPSPLARDAHRDSAARLSTLDSPPSTPLVLGLPSWVFWGVLTPWGAAALASFVFAHRVMILDDLGENEDEPEQMTNDGMTE